MEFPRRDPSSLGSQRVGECSMTLAILSNGEFETEQGDGSLVGWQNQNVKLRESGEPDSRSNAISYDQTSKHFLDLCGGVADDAEWNFQPCVSNSASHETNDWPLLVPTGDSFAVDATLSNIFTSCDSAGGIFNGCINGGFRTFAAHASPIRVVATIKSNAGSEIYHNQAWKRPKMNIAAGGYEVYCYVKTAETKPLQHFECSLYALSPTSGGYLRGSALKSSDIYINVNMELYPIVLSLEVYPKFIRFSIEWQEVFTFIDDEHGSSQGPVGLGGATGCTSAHTWTIHSLVMDKTYSKGSIQQTIFEVPPGTYTLSLLMSTWDYRNPFNVNDRKLMIECNIGEGNTASTRSSASFTWTDHPTDGSIEWTSRQITCPQMDSISDMTVEIYALTVEDSFDYGTCPLIDNIVLRPESCAAPYVLSSDSSACELCQPGLVYANGNCVPCDGINNVASTAGLTQCEICDAGYTKEYHSTSVSQLKCLTLDFDETMDGINTNTPDISSGAFCSWAGINDQSYYSNRECKAAAKLVKWVKLPLDKAVHLAWWEVIVLLRKASFVIATISMRSYGAAAQVLVAIIVLGTAALINTKYTPYDHDDHDTLESMSLQGSTAMLTVALLCNEISRAKDTKAGIVSEEARLGESESMCMPGWFPDDPNDPNRCSVYCAADGTGLFEIDQGVTENCTESSGKFQNTPQCHQCFGNGVCQPDGSCGCTNGATGTYCQINCGAGEGGVICSGHGRCITGEL
eukprot:g2286.t1